MAIDWTEMQQKYAGQWVALAEDEVTVLAFGETAKKALEKAQEVGHGEPILARMPEEIVTYIG